MISGPLTSVVIDGVTYDVLSDTNINFKRSDYTKEAVPTSGKPIIKMSKRAQTVDSVGLACSPAELEVISEKADQIADATLAFVLADGSTFRGTGHINLEGYESESAKITVSFIPVSDWVLFEA